MACNCRDQYGDLAPLCRGTCDNLTKLINISFKRPEKYQPEPKSPYLFENGIKLGNYDDELYCEEME